MSNPLTALAAIISSNAASIESAYASRDIQFPSIADPFCFSPLDADPAVAASSRLIVAAAAQIIANVRSPIETLQELGPSMYITSALGFVVDVNVPDILKEAGATGLDVKHIAAQSGVDTSHMSRVLRFLATRHVFTEVTPNVFANNRISSLLIKSKTLDEIKADPLAKFDGSQIVALVAQSADESLMSSAHLTPYLKNPGTKLAPFNLALNTDESVWGWYESPGNELRARRFTAGMKGGGDIFPPEIFTSGLNGIGLKADDVVVDVGGSIGSVTLMMYKAFPDFRYVVQDLSVQIAEANKFWEVQAPEAISSGRVKLQTHDFFTPQPVQNAAVYFLRVVLHDWPDSAVIKILKALRAAASSSSKLILWELVVQYACEDPNVPDPNVPKAPYPLLANLGIAGGGFITQLDMQMLHLVGGKERTVDEFRALGEACGWKLESAKAGMMWCFVFSAA